MAVTNVDLDALFKKRYMGRKVPDLTLKDHAWLAMIPKNTKFGGKDLTVAVIGGNPQGVGSKFAAAQAAKSTPGDQQAFVVRRGRVYGIWSIDGETLETSEGNENAFLAAASRMMDGVYQAVGFDAAIKSFRDGTGVKGNIQPTSSVALGTGVVTLGNPTDAKYFSRGENISLVDPVGKVYRNPGGNGGATATIIAVDEDGGTITVGTISGGVGTPAALNTFIAGASSAGTGDLIVRDGDYLTNPTPTSGTVLCPTGAAGWIPDVAPGGTDNFWGVNRSVYPTRYAGVRYSNGGGAMKRLFTKLASRICDQNGHPDIAFVDFSNFELLETELEAKKVYMDTDYAGIGFQALEIQGPKGPIKILADNAVQPDRAYMFTRDTWELASKGDWPHMLTGDGRQNIRETSSDSYEWRAGGYGNFICYEPGHNGVGFF